jgi:hypothetical protein
MTFRVLTWCLAIVSFVGWVVPHPTLLQWMR